MSNLPLDETALQAAQEKAEYASYEPFAYDRELVSTYLLEAGFEVEDNDPSLDLSLVKQGPCQRLVGPWVSIVQAESEEK